ncbi:hypothetical protein HPB50_020732 [Hyalomma asiaticum]|uniref:Uncharacterized protein n=1 Tax=Hyalomma asiaticum TaxID=266040 RepID=A0ACB7TNK0_HYAAI|nr:hypothetical protein HPB50_020732 [Hyalomma asiaticum]
MQRASDPTGAVTRMASIRKIPLVITGGEGGKTSPLTVFSNDLCSATASGVYNVTATNADGNHIELASWDAERQEDYGRLKPMSHSDVVLMCFSIDSPDSLVESPKSLTQELFHRCRSLFIILVGNKNCPSFSLTVPHTATTKKDDVAPEE